MDLQTKIQNLMSGKVETAAKKTSTRGNSKVRQSAMVGKLEAFLKENNIDFKTLKALVKHITPKHEVASLSSAQADKIIDGITKVLTKYAPDSFDEDDLEQIFNEVHEFMFGSKGRR